MFYTSNYVLYLKLRSVPQIMFYTSKEDNAAELVVDEGQLLRNIFGNLCFGA